VYGTIQYTGTAGTPSDTKKVYVGVFPSTDTDGFDAGSGSAPNGTTVQGWGYGASSVKFSFAMPAGNYYLACSFDVNGNGIFDTGDKYFIYTPGNAAGTSSFTDSAAVFNIPGNDPSPGRVNVGTLRFGDTYTK